MRGAAHIGVLRALEEFNIPISYVAGTSIGAFVAAFVAFGKDWRQIQEIALDLNWLDVSALSLSTYALLSNQKLGKIIEEHLGKVTFADAEIPLAMVATDITKGEKVVISEGEVAKAAMASTCIPGVFVPVEMDGRLLVDGGIMDNVPVSTVMDMGADYVIGVDLIAKHNNRRPSNIVEVLLNTFDFTLINATRLRAKNADLLIAPDLSEFSKVRTSQIKPLIEKGYQDTKAFLQENWKGLDE